LLFYEVTADAGIGFDKVLDDADAGRVGKGFHHAGQLVLFIGEVFGSCEAHINRLIAILRLNMKL
jgi:hypothetical protein